LPSLEQMRFRTLAIVAGISFGPALAKAQAPTLAEELWDRGTADWKAGKLETGCLAIEESYRLDPQAGALFVSAECQAQWGKPLAAVQRYEAYLALEPQLSRAEHGRRLARARSELTQLKGLVPQLELVLVAPVAGDLQVVLDERPLAAEQLGQPLPVEVGAHRVETRQQGTEIPWRLEFTLARGEKRRIELQLPTAPAVPIAAAPISQLPGGSAAVLVPADSESRSSGVRSTVGWVAGGIGAAGVIVGAAAGITVLHQKNIADKECDEQKVCSPRGLEAVDRGEAWSTVADVSFGVGVVGLLAGAVLLLWDSSPEPSEPAVAWQPVLRAGPGGAWLGVARGW
jgi:hypothetical protein